MSHDLFRREALIGSTDSGFGSPLFYQPLTVRAAVASVTLIFSSFLTFATVVQIKQTELVRGYLAPREGETKIYSEHSGVLREIHVTEGQFVHGGDILASIAAGRSDEHGRHSSAALLQHTDEQIAQLQNRIDTLNQRAVIVLEQIRIRISGLGEELLLMQEEHQALLKRLAIAEQEYNSSAALLARGSIASREHNQVASTWYALLQMSATTRLNQEGKKLALEEARQQLILEPLALKDELSSLHGVLSQLRARRDELASQGLFTLIASVDGTLSNLVSRAGDAVDPRIPFATLTPADSLMEARLYLPSRAVGKLEVGQHIMISYDAYPNQIHGTFAATIASVSATAMDPREYLIPLELSAPVYLVRAEIERQDVGNVQLRSGLQFSAEIMTGSDSLLGRMLYPLTSLGRKL